VGWSTRVAKKAHRCEFCAEQIAPGQRYAHIRLTPWDHADNDGFFTWRTHEFCREMWDEHIGEDSDWTWYAESHEFRDDCEKYAPERCAEYPWDRDCGECDGTGLNDEGVPPCYACAGTGSAYKRHRAVESRTPTSGAATTNVAEAT
jgi:hypothetical protein